MPIFQPQSASSVPSFLINYLETNPDAESDNSGWSTYADAAGTSPVDGTGGAPTVTWTRTTSSPIQGTGSFLFTKDAANRQGEGVSIPFTIRSGDKGKVIRLYVDYNIASGTYADNDMSYWFYDVTNATVIQPSAYQIKNHTLASERSYIEFQTSSSSTSYRLIIHVASTSASAYTLKFDNFVLGPNVKGYGSPITDWNTSWTPTGSWVANTTYTGKWRRVGDSVEYVVQVATSGAPTSASLTINLPSGHTIDTNKINSSTAGTDVLGIAHPLDAGTNDYIALVRYNSTTSVDIRYFTGATTVGANVTQAAPFTFGAGDSVNIKFMVPLVGLSSSAIMSSDADTRLVTARASTAATTINNTTPIVVNGSVGYDSHGVYNSTTGRYTVAVPGKYKVKGCIRFGSNAWTAGQVAELYVYKNGSVYATIDRETTETNNTKTVMLNGDAEVDCIAGDILDVRAYSDPSLALAGGAANYIEINKKSGPAQIAASESVNAKYQSTAGQSISSGSATIIDFATSIFDSHGAVTTGASWKFTAPINGKYLIRSFIEYQSAAAWAIGEWNGLIVYKNGSLDTYIDSKYQQATTTLTVTNGGHTTVRMLAGEYIDVRAHQTSGSAISLATTAGIVYVEIIRVGNY